MNSPVQEKIHIMIGGVRQGAFINGPAPSSPVLLFLHGGPGLPEYALLRRYPTLLEQDFLVCWWEQRGSGLSYSRRLPGPVTEEQLAADAIEMTDYLRDRFGQERIYLMAHSGGSHFGIQVAALTPDRFHAYIGMAQMTNQLESERLAWTYMKREFERAGNRRMVRKLLEHQIPEMDAVPNSYRGLRDKAMHALGIGTTHDMRSVITGIWLPSLMNSQYTPRERLNIWRGKWSANSVNLWNEMVATDLTKKVTRLGLPVYFLHGKFDLTVSYALARQYLVNLDAPTKGFYTFDKSAHSPFIEEPAKTQRILRQDVLHGRTEFADDLDERESSRVHRLSRPFEGLWPSPPDA